jgi:branched-chain amino acid transport system substrate-binding protein
MTISHRRPKAAVVRCNLAAMFFACFLLPLFAAPTAEAQDSQQLEIAVVGPMSGDSKALGQAMVDAVQVRIDEVNALGGIRGRKIKLTAYDDQNDPETAKNIAEKVSKDNKSLLVIGHRTSGASMAAAPVYQQNKIVAISGTATADVLTVNNPWYFRVVYNNSLQASFIANYINSILKFRNVTLISTDSAYAKSLSTAFQAAVEKMPLKVSHHYELKADSPDIDIDMAGIVSELSIFPDSGMVFLAMNARNAAFFVTEMRNSGFSFPIFGADSINQRFPDNFEADPVLKISPGDFTDQIYATTSMIWDVANETAVKFRSTFLKKYGRFADSSMALYYDAASIGIDAIANGTVSGTDLEKDRRAIRDYLSAIDSQEKAFSGITGKIYFDTDGNAMKTVPVGVFQLDQFISAPVQLEAVLDPTKVPNFSDKRERGEIIPMGEGYVHATQIVYTGIDLIEISNLDTATGNYVLDFYIWLRYRGDLDISKIEFPNATGDLRLENPIWSRERNGMTINTFKVRAVFHGEFVFQKYPFDNQEIVLDLRHRDRTSESLSFVVDQLGMRLSGEKTTLHDLLTEGKVFRTSPGWKVTDAAIFQDLVKSASTLGETVFFRGETDINFSRMKLIVYISRNISSYSTTILLPMAILFIIGLFIFAVPIAELAPRLSGGILLLVTASLLRARLSNDLPNIGYQGPLRGSTCLAPAPTRCLPSVSLAGSASDSFRTA